MENIVLLLKQLLQMLIYMSIGYILCRKKIIIKDGSGALSNLLLYIVLPCTIINSFFIEQNDKNIQNMTYSFLLAVPVLLLAILVSACFFRHRCIDNFAASFSNAGFMGIPLVSGVLGIHAVCYVSGFIALLNLLQWTYGQWILTKDKRQISVAACLKSPYVYAFIVGLLIFYSIVPVPELARTVIGSIGGCNAPLAMIVLGLFLGQQDLKEIFTEKHAWQCAAVRLFIIPLLTIALLSTLSSEFQLVKMAILIVSCAPVGSNVVIYAQKKNLDYGYANCTVCLSVLLSVITMPVVISIAQLLW